MRTVWVVEDNPIMASVFRATLAAAGYRVEVMSDGATACARLAGPAPDLVVLDLQLPKVLGIDVLRAIRASAATAAVPVIVLSNSYAGEKLEDVWAVGANQVLTKATCKPAQLVELVRSLVGGPAPGTA